MLRITIPGGELLNEATNEFITAKPQTIQLEHSLVSLAKWESKWKVPFLSKKNITIEQTVDYIRCMTVTQNVDPNLYHFVTNENVDQVNAYIGDSMTATWFSEDEKGKSSREQITAELIYYWMIALGIPFECQKWHLNRLLTLIRVCNVKNTPPKKTSMRQRYSRNASLNAKRRKALHTRG